MTNSEERLTRLHAMPPRRVHFRTDSANLLRFGLIGSAILFMFLVFLATSGGLAARCWGESFQGQVRRTWISRGQRLRDASSYHVDLNFRGALGDLERAEAQVDGASYLRLRPGDLVPIHVLPWILGNAASLDTEDFWSANFAPLLFLFVCGFLLPGFILFSFANSRRFVEFGELHKVKVLERWKGKNPKTKVEALWPDAARKEIWLTGLPTDRESETTYILALSAKAILVNDSLPWEVEPE